MPRLAPLLLAAALLLPAASNAADGFEVLEPGLELATFEGPTPSGEIAVVRIDPARFELRLLNASSPGEGTLRSARAWAYRTGASAAINAAMYQEDHKTSVSLMRSRDHVNQRRISKDRAFLAFDPVVSGVPPARILDLDCEPLEPGSLSYGALVQSIRLVSCHRKNVWAPSEQRFSIAAIGVDGAGRVLFVHARTPWPVHDLVNRLLALPLDLHQAMYVEGGPEAQLFARGGGKEVELTGTFGSGPDVLGSEGWPVPNVIAAVRRPAPLAPPQPKAPPRPPAPAPPRKSAQRAP